MKRVVTRRAKALKRAIDRRRSSERLVEHVFENVTIEGSPNLFTLKCTTRRFAYEIPEHLAKHLEKKRKVSQTQTAVVKSCSECGFEYGVETESSFPFEVTIGAVEPPNYCPNCGARVIEEEL